MGLLDHERIPPELKARPQWVCWSLENREGKPTKVPKNPKTGGNAMANDPGTWGEFDLAVRHWEAHKNNGIAGIGFQFSPDDPFTGIDLDKCRDPETGEIEPWAQKYISRFNSYTELSPSGTGVHIIIKANVPPGGNRKDRVEMYDSSRYFTVTGYHMEGTPLNIEPRQVELDALHLEIFGKPSEESGQAPDRSTKAAPTNLSDDDLVNKISNSKNSGKFKALWQYDEDSRGWLKYQYGYTSQSEADLALCSILAFWTGKDPTAIDRIFRKSNLMRPKWDEYRGDQTYGEMTIAKAISDTKEVWKGGVRRKRKAKQKKCDANGQNAPKAVNCIEQLNKKHAIVMIGGKCAIMNEIIDPIFHRPDVTFSSIYDFKNYYKNAKIEFINKEGKKSEVALSTLWLESPNRRQYEGIVFAPGQDISGFYNLFRGFAVKPAKGDWSLFRNHILEIIADANQEYFQYLLAWMARLVQDPGGERPGVAIALRGEIGTGKGCFVSQFGEIIGSHYLHIINPTHLVHRFNNHLKDCLLCFVDEGIWVGDKMAEGVLKGMITEKYFMVEPKGKDAFPVKNHIHLIIASNSEWLVPAGFEERRFFVLDVNNKHKGDYEYFTAIFDQMDHGGREAMLYDLLEMTIGVDLRKIPRTNALLDQVVFTMPTAHKFWLERLRAGTLLDEHKEWEGSVITEKLFKSYLEFAANCGDRYRLIDRQFTKELKHLCPDIRRVRRTINGHRPWVLEFPELETCREKFESVVGIKINWDQEPNGIGDHPF